MVPFTAYQPGGDKRGSCLPTNQGGGQKRQLSPYVNRLLLPKCLTQFNIIMQKHSYTTDTMVAVYSTIINSYSVSIPSTNLHPLWGWEARLELF